MSDFETVAKAGDIPEGQGRCFPVNGTMVGVFCHKGEHFAINDFCPHMGASLAEGHVSEDGSVMCPWHAWSFCIKDGTWLDNRKSGIKTQTYEVRLHEEQIQVLVPPPPSPAATETSDDENESPDSEAGSDEGGTPA